MKMGRRYAGDAYLRPEPDRSVSALTPEGVVRRQVGHLCLDARRSRSSANRLCGAITAGPQGGSGRHHGHCGQGDFQRGSH